MRPSSRPISLSQPGFSWNYASSGTTATGTGFTDPTQLPVNIAQMLSVTGGIALNTADSNWEGALDTFWEAIVLNGKDYRLSGTPSQGASGIAVFLNGVPIKQLASPGNPNWTYRSGINALEFTTNDPPRVGDSISVTYSVCSQ